MYMIKAQKKLADIERKEQEDRRIEALGGLKIVQGAVSPDIPDDGPKGAKKKVKVCICMLNGICFSRISSNVD